MSMWYEPKLEDIDITEDGEELHVYLYSDYSGAIYASFKVKELEDLIKAFGKKKNKKDSKSHP